VHLSAGDLLRHERESNGPQAQQIEDAIKSGQIVPAEVTVGLLKKSIESHTASGRTQFLIDGFPRNVENLKAWKTGMGAYVELLFVLYFDCDQATMRERVLQRGESSGRADDNEEALQKRFTTYTEQSQPVIARYESTGRAVKIDANHSEDAVWAEVRRVFAPIGHDTQAMPKKEALVGANGTAVSPP
jgi:adenylate kinase family enzyme